jgi:uncharacterized membrane protein (UPF0127 family)
MPNHPYRVYNLTHPLKEPLYARYCASFFCHFWGVSFRKQLPLDEGLLLVYNREGRINTGIHMLGVFMDLTIVWINSLNNIVDVRLARSWRPLYIPKKPARNVLELHSSRLNEFHIGDALHFESQ